MLEHNYIKREVTFNSSTASEVIGKILLSRKQHGEYSGCNWYMCIDVKIIMTLSYFNLVSLNNEACNLWKHTRMYSNLRFYSLFLFKIFINQFGWLSLSAVFGFFSFFFFVKNEKYFFGYSLEWFVLNFILTHPIN